MLPFFVNTNKFEYPFSGNVVQDISPAFIASMKGRPEVEHAVVTNIASYGDQLGTLTDAVLAIARDKNVSGNEIGALQKIADAVKATKQRYNAELRSHAETTLDRLKKADPIAYERVVANEQAKINKGNDKSEP